MIFEFIRKNIDILKKNKYKMIACDLDGTLFGSDLRVSKENNQAISEFFKRGIPFVPCTGRTLSEMEEMVENPDIRYIIYSNGAGILDKKTGERIGNGFPHEVKGRLFDILSGYEFFPLVHADGKCYMNGNFKGKEIEYNLPDAICRIVNNTAIPFSDFEKEFSNREVESLSIFFKNQDEREKCREQLASDDMLVVSESWSLNLEVFYVGAGKANGIKILADKLGIDIKEVVSVGDSGNDAEALEICGLGICVSNGNDEIKKIADEIACSNDENVAEYILRKYF